MDGGRIELAQGEPKGSIFASPPAKLCHSLTDWFYHVTVLPELGLTRGCWDLRGRVADYLGFTLFENRRVLEIGPASGFLTTEMERLGAEVVAVEVTDDHGWDFVPYPPSVLSPKTLDNRKFHLTHMKDSFWLNHQQHKLTAKLLYADVYNLPDEIGKFDIALLGAVLLHTENPLRIIAECAKRAAKIIITEPYYRDIDELGPIVRLHPTTSNNDWGTWWHFTPTYLQQYLGVLGFTTRINFHQQFEVQQKVMRDYFTIVASRA